MKYVDKLLVLPLPALAKMPHTKEKEYGLLPTPIANDCMTGMKITQGKYRVSKNGFKTTGKLTDWSVSNMLPTPLKSDAHKTTKTSKQNNLNKTFQTGGNFRLNPQFVEEMMGFPIGWTDLNL